MPRKLKIHLYRSSRSTWCGRDTDSSTGNLHDWRPLSASVVTHDRNDVTCRTCLKANAAEQSAEDEASS